MISERQQSTESRSTKDSSGLAGRVTGSQGLFLRLASYLLGIFVLRTFLLILWEYRFYFPPDLKSGFLVLHASHFDGIYQAAFYLHIITAPVALILFSFLSWGRMRKRYTRLHRMFGNVNTALILFLFVPSSVFIACFSIGGWVAASGFIASSIALAICVLAGWVSAKWNTAMHPLWMVRAFSILLSAVALRAFGGATEALSLPPIASYQISTWLSWLIPLACVEFAMRYKCLQLHGASLRFPPVASNPAKHSPIPESRTAL